MGKKSTSKKSIATGTSAKKNKSSKFPFKRLNAYPLRSLIFINKDIRTKHNIALGATVKAKIRGKERTYKVVAGFTSGPMYVTYPVFEASKSAKISLSDTKEFTETVKYLDQGFEDQYERFRKGSFIIVDPDTAKKFKLEFGKRVQVTYEHPETHKSYEGWFKVLGRGWFKKLGKNGKGALKSGAIYFDPETFKSIGTKKEGSPVYIFPNQHAYARFMEMREEVPKFEASLKQRTLAGAFSQEKYSWEDGIAKFSSNMYLKRIVNELYGNNYKAARYGDTYYEREYNWGVFHKELILTSPGNNKFTILVTRLWTHDNGWYVPNTEGGNLFLDKWMEEVLRLVIHSPEYDKKMRIKWGQTEPHDPLVLKEFIAKHPSGFANIPAHNSLMQNPKAFEENLRKALAKHIDPHAKHSIFNFKINLAAPPLFSYKEKGQMRLFGYLPFSAKIAKDKIFKSDYEGADDLILDALVIFFDDLGMFLCTDPTIYREIKKKRMLPVPKEYNVTSF